MKIASKFIIFIKISFQNQFFFYQNLYFVLGTPSLVFYGDAFGPAVWSRRILGACPYDYTPKLKLIISFRIDEFYLESTKIFVVFQIECVFCRKLFCRRARARAGDAAGWHGTLRGVWRAQH